MVTNDISIRPFTQQIIINGSDTTYYHPTTPTSDDNHIRPTQAHILPASRTSSVIWPGEYLKISIPSEIDPDTTLAIEPRPDYSKTVHDWPRPHILEAVAGQIRILNATAEPKTISRYEHFFQVRLTRTPEATESKLPRLQHSIPICSTLTTISYTL